MTAKNDITGDAIQTKIASDKYRENYDSIFSREEHVEPYVYKEQVLLVTNLMTDNGLIYPYSALRNALNHWLIYPMHYGSFAPERTIHGDLSLEDIAFNVTKLKLTRSGLLLGDIRIANTTKGKILRRLIDGGVEITFRPDIMATVKDGIVQDDMKIVQFVAMSKSETTDYSSFE